MSLFDHHLSGFVLAHGHGGGIYAGGLGTIIFVIVALLAWLLDDGSRYLCPRCGASLRPYVKSCRFCRARFKVQPMTPGRREQTADRSFRIKPAKALPLPDPETMKRCFRLPPREPGEPDILNEQKRQFEQLGATDLASVEHLGCYQAQYFLKFRVALAESERQQATAAANVKPTHLWRWAGVGLSSAVVLVGVYFWFPHKVAGLTATGTPTAAVSAVPTTLDKSKADAPPDRERNDATPMLALVPTATLASSAAVPVPSFAGSTRPVVNIVPDDLSVMFAREVAASQKRALANHPTLGDAGSHFNAAFLARYHLLQQQHNPLLRKPDWPERIANECSAALPAGYQ